MEDFDSSSLAPDSPGDVEDSQASQTSQTETPGVSQSQGSQKTSSQKEPSKRKAISTEVTLQIPKNVKMDKGFVLVEVSDPSMNLGGDTGVVGRLKSTKDTIVLDLKGSVYEGRIIPCNSMMVVSIGADTAKCEAVVGRYVPAKGIGNIFDAEVMTGSMAFDANEVDIDADVNVNNSQSVFQPDDDEDKPRKRKKTKS